MVTSYHDLSNKAPEPIQIQQIHPQGENCRMVQHTWVLSERHPQGFPHASGTLLGSAGTWPLTVLTPDNALRMKRKKTPERHPTLLTSRNDVDVAYRTAWDEGLDVLEQKSCIQSRYAHACPSVCICEDRTGSSLGGLLQAMSPVGSPGRR